MIIIVEYCRLCPRDCGVDRSRAPGRCGAGLAMRAARAALHFWEEPCISGLRGSGAVFFSGCSLGCVFCQNYKISACGEGHAVTPEQLAKIILTLQASGAHNINLVNPVHFLPGIEQAICLAGSDLHIPIIANTSGYERSETIRRYAGLFQVYLPDLKFFASSLSQRYCRAPDYFEFASKALQEMFRLAGKPVFDADGMLLRGMCVRHLVMPGCGKDTNALLLWLSDHFPKDGIIISLMSQYTPLGRASEFSEINRRLTTYEYNKALETLDGLGFKFVYTQGMSSASGDFVPEFNGEGLELT